MAALVSPFIVAQATPLLAATDAALEVKWSRTAMHKSGSDDFFKDMPPLTLVKMKKPSERALSVDRGTTYQKIIGFGGAFTEASALNWRSLSKKDQDEVIRLYFGKGGLGYTLGRVPMNSCDFGPGDPKRTYSFDDVADDVDLNHFDDTVAHDVESGMIPMIQAAMEAAGGTFTLFASPWSPPAWMKLPVDGVRSMTRTAVPNGLDPAMQRPWAKYFSRFISAYKKHGIPMWGVTIQNEAEAADVGWEKMVWTPQFQAEFVRDHLGPVLHKEQPGVKIIGFDHNKDHVRASCARWPATSISHCIPALPSPPCVLAHRGGAGSPPCCAGGRLGQGPLRRPKGQRVLRRHWRALVRRAEYDKPGHDARYGAGQVYPRDRGVQLPRCYLPDRARRVVGARRASGYGYHAGERRGVPWSLRLPCTSPARMRHPPDAPLVSCVRPNHSCVRICCTGAPDGSTGI